MPRRLLLFLAVALTLAATGTSAASAATFTVTSTADSGTLASPTTGTLRWAVKQANGNAGPDVIEFAEDVVGVVTLRLGEIEITQSLTINGPSRDVLTVQGSGSRIFAITTTPIAVEIVGLTLARGNEDAQPGGAIGATTLGSEDALTVRRCRVEFNTASNGGGIYASNGTVTIDDTEFVGNVAADSGGGVYLAEGTLTVEGSLFWRNTARGYGGGGLYTERATTTIGDSSFSLNEADDYGGGVGAEDVLGLTIADASFERNVVYKSGGGAVYAQSAQSGPSAAATYTFSRLDVYDNRAAYGSAFDVEGSDVYLADSVLRGNHGERGVLVVLGGRTDMTITRTAIVENTPGDSTSGHGGIRWDGDRLTIANSTIADNVSDVANTGAALYVQEGSADLDSVTIAGNVNLASGASGIVVDRDQNPATASVTNAIVSGNDGADCAVLGTDSSPTALALTGPNVADASCTPSGSAVADPLLDALRPSLTTDGLYTYIRPLQRTSPAWDTGATTLTTDQRGVARPQLGGTDVGAVEMREAALAVTVGEPPSAQVGDRVDLSLGIENTGDFPADVALALQLPTVLAYAGPAEGASCEATMSGAACAVGLVGGETLQSVIVPASARAIGTAPVDVTVSARGLAIPPATASTSVSITGPAVAAAAAAAAASAHAPPTVGTCVRRVGDVRLTPRATRRQPAALLTCRFSLDAVGRYAFSFAKGDARRWSIYAGSRVAGRETGRRVRQVAIDNRSAGRNVTLRLRLPQAARWVPATVTFTAPSGARTTQILG